MNDPGFGIYIHWPFCQHKCPYCDFNSHVHKETDHTKWRNAYLSAIDYWREYRQGEALTSIYFGGGTPSTCPPETIATIIERIRDYWLIEQAEITLEANPSSVDASRFASYASAGVNRVSIGFQAFNNHDLKKLGRLHDVDESLKALDVARKYFDRTSFDLIYARQNQSLIQWKNELKQALKLFPSHISLYQLTIEPNTRFGQLYDRGKLIGLPDEGLAYEMFVETRDTMRAHGFEHYEVSNFALPGDQSRHNMVYWNYGDYLGIGPGAHGRIWRGQRFATSQQSMPNQWLERPNEFSFEALSNIEAAEEYILMGLRIETGIYFERLDQLGFQLPSATLAELIDQGLMIQDNLGIRATDQGRLLLNNVTSKLLTQ